MGHVCFNSRWYFVPRQTKLLAPIKNILPRVPPLRSRSNKPLTMNTEELINILTYYHLQVFSSGRESIRALREDEYARHLITPAGVLSLVTCWV